MSAVWAQEPWVFVIAIGAIIAVVWAYFTGSASFRQRNELRSELDGVRGRAPLSVRLKSIAQEISALDREFRDTRPAPHDRLNYTSDDIEVEVNHKGQGNMVVGPGASGFELRVMKNWQDERRNHEVRYLERFNGGLAGLLLARLAEARALGVFDDQDMERLRGMLSQCYLGNATGLFVECANYATQASAALDEVA